MEIVDYLEGINNIDKTPYGKFVNREAIKRDIVPSEMEKILKTETIAMEFPNHGLGSFYGKRSNGEIDNPLKKLSEQYDAIIDFEMTPYTRGPFAFLTGCNKILVQGTGIKITENKYSQLSE